MKGYQLAAVGMICAGLACAYSDPVADNGTVQITGPTIGADGGTMLEDDSGVQVPLTISASIPQLNGIAYASVTTSQGTFDGGTTVSIPLVPLGTEAEDGGIVGGAIVFLPFDVTSYVSASIGEQASGIAIVVARDGGVSFFK